MRTNVLAFIISMLSAWSSLSAQTALDNILSPYRLPYLKNSKLIQISSFDSTGGNSDRITLRQDEMATLAAMAGPGVITRIWMTIDSSDPYFLRRIILRMYWDGEANSSVEVPIGDFFGTGFEYKQYISQFVGMSSGGYYCYFPMPFNKSARVEVENQTGQEVRSFYYHIDYQKIEEPLPPDVAYFHAQWRRELRTDPKSNYTILEAEGRGHFVGVNMSLQSYERRLWFLEGDEMVYVDGEKFPSIYGTGTEDYFTSGWYYNRGEFAAPYHGLIIKDDTTGRIATYRFHVGDAIPFKTSIRFTIEHGHANTEIADYSSTAYWYQLEPHKKFPPLLEASLRIPLRVAVPNGVSEAESLTPQGTKLKSHVMDMSAYGPDWSGLQQLKIEAQKEGDAFSLDIPQAVEDRYSVDLYFTKGPEYGNVDIIHEGNKVGEIIGYHAEVSPGGKINLKHLKSANDELTLKFVVTGKDKKSSGYAIGLDAFIPEPERSYIPEWYMLGPFPNPKDDKENRLGLDTVYPPEQQIDFSKTYTGANGQPIHWTLEKTPEDGHTNLYRKYDPYELVIVYALTYIYSPTEQTVPLLLGSDDGIKVFLKDKAIYRKFLVRIATPDEDKISLELKRGWNMLLLKIENNLGGYGFYARVRDRGHSLIVSANKKKNTDKLRIKF